MTLDIERERREFEAWYEADALPAESDWFKKDDGGDYFHAATYSAWSAWLAAKRAAQGSAEPVALRYPARGKFYHAGLDDTIPAGVKTELLYNAPPAPVSAEVVQAQINAAINALAGIDYVGGVDVGIKVLRNQIADLEQKNDAMFASLKKRDAPPPTDAKDSEQRYGRYTDDKLRQIGAEVYRACEALPFGYEIIIELENGAGSVTLSDPEGNRKCVEGSDFFGGDIRDAIDIALAEAIAAKEAGKS